MSHVDKEVGTYLVGDFTHAGKIELPGVGAAATDDQLGLLANGLLLELVVVDGFGVAAHLIAGDFVEFAREIKLVAVGEVAAVGEVEPEDGVAGGEQRHKGGSVGLRAGVRLHVDVVGAEELFARGRGRGLRRRRRTRSRRSKRLPG